MSLLKPLFTATGTVSGGRNGHGETDDGMVKVDLSVPKSMGGPGKPGTATPEHLFAIGYAACYGGAIDYVAAQQKKNGKNAKITCAVTLGTPESGGFALAVKMRVEDKTIPQAELEAIAKDAHEKVCPYSKAIHNNVQVDFEIVGG